MAYSRGKVAGTLFFVAAAQFVLGLIVSEALYPNYSIADNYVSDLGVGPSSMIFNSSVILLGLLLIMGTYFLQRTLDLKLLTALLILTGIGAIGVGVFTEDFQPSMTHLIVSAIAFLFSGLAAIYSGVASKSGKSRLVRMPFSVISVVLGLMTLGALGLFALGIDLGLGAGGMERMIVYPTLLWGAGFGGHLIAHPEI